MRVCEIVVVDIWICWGSVCGKLGKSHRCVKILDEECKCNGVDNGFCILEFESMILKFLLSIV